MNVRNRVAAMVFLTGCLLSILPENSFALLIRHSAAISIYNIKATGLDSLLINSKTFDSNSTYARAIAAEKPYTTQPTTVPIGTAEATSAGGTASSFASLNWSASPDSPFMGDSFQMWATSTIDDYGYADSSSGFSQMTYFTALAPVSVTLSFDYSGMDDGINPGPDPFNYSSAGIGYNIANFNEAIYQGFAGSLGSANLYSPYTMATTMHFAAGDTGWFALGASAGTALYRANDNVAPVPEPATMLLLGVGLASLAGLRRRPETH